MGESHKRMFMALAIGLLNGCGDGARIDSESDTELPVISHQTIATGGLGEIAWRALLPSTERNSAQAQVSADGNLGRCELDGERLQYRAEPEQLGEDRCELRIDSDAGHREIAISITGIDTRSRGAAGALRHADIDLVDNADALLEVAREGLLTLEQRATALRARIIGDDPVDYRFGNRNQFFLYSDLERISPIITGAGGKDLVVAGRTEGGDRFVASGVAIQSAILDRPEHPLNAQSERLIDWLLNDSGGASAARSIAVAMFRDDFGERTRSWFRNRYPNWQISICTEITALADCTAGSDLVVLGWNGAGNVDQQTAEAQVARLRERATPLWYQHEWMEYTSNFSIAVTAALGLQTPYGGNYWAKDEAWWPDHTAAEAALPGLPASTLISGLLDDSLSVDWSACYTSVGKVFCLDAPGLKDVFYPGAKQLLAGLTAAERKHGDLLRSPAAPKWLRAALMFADKYRAEIRYPMDKRGTDGGSFLRAYLADHLINYARPDNRAQPDMGNFSRSGLDGAGEADATVSFDGGNRYRSTGLYALPGTPIEIRLRTEVDAEVEVFFNAQRSGSTREFNANGYQRPKFLRSRSYTLPVDGSALVLSTPYGGPLFLRSRLDGAVSVAVNGVRRMPALRDFDDSATASYLSELSADTLDWTGIYTDYVEISSRADMMRASIAAPPYHNDLNAWAGDIWKYMIKGTYELAGFVGEGLQTSEEVLARCDALGWDCLDPSIHRSPGIQHINVDKAANCGAGCAGNPYDQAWPLKPTGWGESHEIGHNLQRHRLKVYGSRSNEVSNNIFPSYVNHQRAVADESFKARQCPSETVYDWLQEARRAEDPLAAARTRLWGRGGIYDESGQRLEFYTSLPIDVVHSGALNNGWSVFTLMYLHERLFTEALKHPDEWADRAPALGMAAWSSPPSGISGNDFMLLSLARITGHDYRDYFAAWGVAVGAVAAQAVADTGLSGRPAVMYKGGNCSQPLSLVARPIDGVSSW